MAKYRQISTEFWDDPYIIARGGIHADFRLLFLWCITNPRSEICGAFEVAIDKIMIETGLSEQRILDGFAKLQRDGKVLYRDDWVVVRNQRKWQQNQSPKIQAAIRNGLAKAPEWILDTLRSGFGHIDIQPQQPSLIEPPTARQTPNPSPKQIKPATDTKSGTAAHSSSDDKDRSDDDTEGESKHEDTLRTITLEKVKHELKKRLRIPDKGTLPNQRNWEAVIRTGFANGLAPDEIVEVYDFLRLQDWRRNKTITPANIEDHLTPAALDALRDEIAAQEKSKENGNGKHTRHNGSNGRRKSTVERIADHASIISEYPSEAELRHQP